MKTTKFSSNDNNKFILLLRKGVYPYEYMVDSEKFNETTLPRRKRRILYQLKYGRYYRCRLHAWKKSS